MSDQTRRDFLKHTTAAAATFSAGCASPQSSAHLAKRGPLIVSTWGFGKPANEVALKTLQSGGSALDAVEQGVRLVETSGNTSVGLSGKPNAAGVVQLAACIMNGPGHQAGSVAGVEGVVHPISAARLVMEKTPHVMLVGAGAHWFAEQNGLEVRDGQADKANYREWLARQKRPTPGKGDKPENHDTIAQIILDADGNIAGGCSTSGWSGKVPGRVGDSPIIGGGVYVDNEVGAAGATGSVHQEIPGGFFEQSFDRWSLELQNSQWCDMPTRQVSPFCSPMQGPSRPRPYPKQDCWFRGVLVLPPFFPLPSPLAPAPPPPPPPGGPPPPRAFLARAARARLD